MRAVMLEAQWDPRPGYQPSPRELALRKAAKASGVWRHPRFVAAEVPEPRPARDEVVLRVRAAGICGSDTHCYEHDAEGYVLFSGPLRAPCIVGHEFAAEVVEVGPEVRNLRRGELVAAEGMLYCRVCEACRGGRPNQCSDLDMVGFSAPGAFATWITLEERLLWSLDPLAEALGDARRALALGAMVEPLAVAWNGVFATAGGFAPGAHVAVFGCGPIGLGAVALARAGGAATVMAIEPIAERRALAVALGADHAWDPATTPVGEAIRETTRGWGADLVVEAAGAALDTLPEIEPALAAGGTLVYLGRTGLSAPMALDVLVTQAARIVGARGHAGAGSFPRILRMLERGRLPVEPMITRRFPFADALAALAASRSRVDGKILLENFG